MGTSMRRLGVELLIVSTLLALVPLALGKPNKTEAQLIEMLNSRDYQKVIDALDRLPHWYPDSTNALSPIKNILKSKVSIVPPNVPENILARKAARALGYYHATLSHEELEVLFAFLDARDPNVVMDALKAFRGLDTPEAVPRIIPLLKDPNTHVVQDSCRTLGVLGNKDTIATLTPLLKHSKADVRKDARDAISKLQGKP